MWTFIIIVVLFIIGKFLWAMFDDSTELNTLPLEEKFKTMVNILNIEVMESNGQTKKIDKKYFVLHNINNKIHFMYGTGHLTIIWEFDLIFKKLTHKKQINNVRNITPQEQIVLAGTLIEEMTILVTTERKLLLGE